MIEYRDRVFSFPFSLCFSRVFDDFHHARSRDCDSLSFVSYRWREQIHALLLQPQRFNADCGPSLAKGTVANNNAGRDSVVVPRRRRRQPPPLLLLLLLLVAGVIGVGWFSVYENLARDDDDDGGLSFLFPRLYSLLMGFSFFFLPQLTLTPPLFPPCESSE